MNIKGHIAILFVLVISSYLAWIADSLFADSGKTKRLKRWALPFESSILPFLLALFIWIMGEAIGWAGWWFFS